MCLICVRIKHGFSHVTLSLVNRCASRTVLPGWLLSRFQLSSLMSKLNNMLPKEELFGHLLIYGRLRISPICLVQHEADSVTETEVCNVVTS